MEPITFQEYREKLLKIGKIYDECKDSQKSLDEFLEMCENNGISKDEIQSSALAELIKSEEVTGTTGIAQATLPIGMEKRKKPVEI